MSGICRTAGREVGGGKGVAGEAGQRAIGRATLAALLAQAAPPLGSLSSISMGPMLAGSGANGASKIRSEPAVVAAAPEVRSIRLVQHTLPMGKLVQVQGVAEGQLGEYRRGVGRMPAKVCTASFTSVRIWAQFGIMDPTIICWTIIC
jgi:hypothetical protein